MSLRFLSGSEWAILRDARLSALRESPRWFLSAYETEKDYDPHRWWQECTRGSWLIDLACEGEPQAVLGAIRADDVDPEGRCLCYLWVAPPARGRGVGTRLVTEMLTHLQASGVGRVWLWVLDGNEPARRLYRKLGFESTGVSKPLRHDPSRYEELLTRRSSDLPAPAGEATCQSCGN